MRNYFPKRPSDAPLHTLSKSYDFPVGLITPPPILRLCIALFAVADWWLLLDIGWFVLFSYAWFNVWCSSYCTVNSSPFCKCVARINVWCPSDCPKSILDSFANVLCALIKALCSPDRPKSIHDRFANVLYAWINAWCPSDCAKSIRGRFANVLYGRINLWCPSDSPKSIRGRFAYVLDAFYNQILSFKNVININENSHDIHLRLTVEYYQTQRRITVGSPQRRFWKTIIFHARIIYLFLLARRLGNFKIHIEFQTKISDS